MGVGGDHTESCDSQHNQPGTSVGWIGRGAGGLCVCVVSNKWLRERLSPRSYDESIFDAKLVE